MDLRLSALNLAKYPPARLIELARLQEACGYETFWYTDERFFREVYSGLTLAAVHTRNIKLGTMVTDPYTRHPALTAIAIATVDEVAEGRAVLGLGAGVAGFTEMQLVRHQPAQAMREAVTVVRQLLGGATVDMHGQVVTLAHGRLDFPPLRAHVPVYIASNGRLGLALAGEIAEGAVMQGAVAAPLVAWFLAQVQRGAQRVGRSVHEVDIVSRVNLCLHPDAGVAKDVMRPAIARSLITQYPHFRTFTTAGLEIPPHLQELIATVGYTHDPALLAPVAGQVPDAFVDAVTLAGTVEDVATCVRRMAQQGIKHIMVYPQAPDGDVERVLTSFAHEVIPSVRDQGEEGLPGTATARL